MAVIKVTQPHAGCSVSQRRDGVNLAGEATLVYQVEFDSDETMAGKQSLALTASGGGVTVPNYGDTHPWGPEWFVVDKKARPGIGPLSWFVDVTYRYQQNPLERFAEVKWDTVEESAIVENDIDGQPVANSAGEPFDPPPREMATDLVGRITYAAATYDPLIVADYTNAVNNDNIQIDRANFPAYVIKINKWTFTPAYWGNVLYYEVYLEIHIRLAYKPGTTNLYGWQRQQLNQGFFYRDAKLNKRRILEKNLPENFGIDLTTLPNNGENPIDSPIWLNDEGHIISNLTGFAKPSFLYFKTKKQRSFNIFQLRWRT